MAWQLQPLVYTSAHRSSLDLSRGADRAARCCNFLVSLRFARQCSAQLCSSSFRIPSHQATMRPLTEEESKAVFTKLANYIVRVYALGYHELTLSSRLRARILYT